MANERRLWILPPLVTLLVGWVSLVYPHGRDQGSYAYAGWRMLQGEVPYRDVFVFKPPNSVFMHAFANGVFGLDPSSIRILDLGWTAATGLVVARFVHALGGSFQAGIWAGCLVPWFYYQVDYWNTAQTDGWLVLPAAAALVLFTLERPWHWAVAGALAMVAILFKYTAAAFVIPLLLLLLVVPDRKAQRLAAFTVAALVVGLLAVASLWVSGAWPAFLDSQVDLVPNYVSEGRKSRTVLSSLWRLVNLPGSKLDVAPLLTTAILGGLAATGLLKRPAAGVLLGSLLATVLMVVAQGKYYDYHYLPLLLPACVAGGLVLDAVRLRAQRRVRHVAAVGLVWAGLLVGLLLTPWLRYATEAVQVAVSDLTRDELWERGWLYRYTDYNVGEIEDAASWIAANTAPDEAVFTWTYEPEVNLRAERKQVSRFLYNYMFRLAWEVSDYDTELEAALDADPPVLIVVGSQDARRGVTGTDLDSMAAMRANRVLGPLVRDHYCEVHREGRYRMYRPCTK